MDIEWFRDLVICIAGLVATGVLIFIAVLAYLIYHRAKPVIDSAKNTSRTIERISSRVVDDVVKPVIELASLIQGVRQGMGFISKFFKKKEEAFSTSAFSPTLMMTIFKR